MALLTDLVDDAIFSAALGAHRAARLQQQGCHVCHQPEYAPASVPPHPRNTPFLRSRALPRSSPPSQGPTQLFYASPTPHPSCMHRLPAVPGREVFGNQPDVNAAPAFQCSHCKLPIKPARFTTHLEKCMGLGRTATRTSRGRTELRSRA